METAVRATDAERAFFLNMGWEYIAETDTKHESFQSYDLDKRVRILVHRPDGWCSRFNGGRLPDPITAYVNAEVEGWAS